MSVKEKILKLLNELDQDKIEDCKKLQKILNVLQPLLVDEELDREIDIELSHKKFKSVKLYKNKIN